MSFTCIPSTLKICLQLLGSHQSLSDRPFHVLAAQLTQRRELPRLEARRGSWEPSDPVSSHLLSPQRRPGLAGAGGAGLAGAGGATPAGTLSCGCWELSLVHLPVRPLRHSPWGAEVGKFAKVSERGSEGTHTGQHCLSCGRTDGQTDERCWEWRGRRLLSPPRPPAQAGGKGRCHGELREGETWRWGPTRWAPEPPPGNPLCWGGRVPHSCGTPKPWILGLADPKLVSQ